MLWISTKSQKDGQNYENTGVKREILPKGPSRRANPSLDGRLSNTEYVLLKKVIKRCLQHLSASLRKCQCPFSGFRRSPALPEYHFVLLELQHLSPTNSDCQISLQHHRQTWSCILLPGGSPVFSSTGPETSSPPTLSHLSFEMKSWFWSIIWSYSPENHQATSRPCTIVCTPFQT